MGPVEQDVAQDVSDLMTNIEDEYAKQAEGAQKRIQERFAKMRKAFEKGLKAAKSTDGKADDKAIKEALDKLDKQEAAAIKRSVERYKNLTNQAKRAVGQITTALLENARAQDEVNARLLTAQDNLKALQDQAADFANGVKDAFTKYGEIVGLGVRQAGEEAVVTSETLLEDLRKKVEKARHFAQLIAQLAAAGLSQAAIQQLIAAGVEGGMATAEAIAAGGAGAVDEVNAMTAELTDIGAQLGGDLAGTYYGAGIAAAQSVVDGLVIDQASLASQAAKLRTDLETALGTEANAGGKTAGKRAIQGLVEGLTDDDGKLNHAGKKVAHELVKAFKDELGIHSPSRVTHKMGELVGLGFANGISAMEGQVAKASGDLTAAMITAAGTPTIRAAFEATQSGLAASLSSGSVRGLGGPGGAGPLSIPTNPQSLVDVRVFIGDKELTDQVRVVVGETLKPLTRMSRQGALS
jgi:hypothetical protein